MKAIKIRFEPGLREEIIVCRISGRIIEKNFRKLWEGFEKINNGSSVIISLDKVSEIDGAGLIVLNDLTNLFDKLIFYCSPANQRVQNIWALAANFSLKYPLYESEAVATAHLKSQNNQTPISP